MTLGPIPLGCRRPAAAPRTPGCPVLHLYGLNREEAEYVLGTFPIVREQEEAAYGGRFRTRDLVLNYMAALAAGDPDAKVEG